MSNMSTSGVDPDERPRDVIPPTPQTEKPGTQSINDSGISETAVQQPLGNVASPALTPGFSTQVNPAASLDQFYYFQRFPLELRLKIWGYGANFPRVIELDNINDSVAPTQWLRNQYRKTVRVAPNSRAPPAILHVNQESRKEALRYYELQNFENKATRYGIQYTHAIFYNPQADIVYFGEQSTIETLDAVLRMGFKIPNIGICIQYDWNYESHGDDDNYGPTNVEVLELLHGSEKGLKHHSNSVRPGVGAKGLQRVLFVLPSQFRPCGGNNISVRMKILTHEGLDEYTAQKNANREYDPLPAAGTSGFPTTQDMMRYNEVGGQRKLKGLTRWNVATRPQFLYASLRTDHLVGKLRDDMEVEMDDFITEIIGHKNSAVIRKIMANTGCSICVGIEYTYFNPMSLTRSDDTSFRKIEFFGSANEITAAKLEVEKVLATLKGKEKVSDEEMDADHQESGPK